MLRSRLLLASVFALAACDSPATDGPSGPSSSSSSGTGGDAPAPVIEIRDAKTGVAVTGPVLFFDQIDVHVGGLVPGTQATITATMGTGYQSHATFSIGDWGSITTLYDAPVEGTYDEADADGLFWSMEKIDPNATFETIDVHYDVSVDGVVVASADLARLKVAADVKREDVDMGSGLVGALYTPAAPGPHPVVIGFGGSEGGLYFGDLVGRALASIGYTSLGVAYFGAPGLPAGLTDVPLEYFGTAIDYVSARPEADPDRIAVMGASRGGELALLLGAKYPAVKAVVADVPSGLVWGSASTFDAGAWTDAGVGLPFVPTANVAPTITKAADGKNIYHETPTFLASMAAATPAELDAATIRVENTAGPILFIGGGADELWPSCQLSQIAMDRLTAGGHTATFADELHCYPDSGHWTDPLNVGYPMTGATQTYSASLHAYLALGGTPKGVAHAARDSWNAMRTFLETALH